MKTRRGSVVVLADDWPEPEEADIRSAIGVVVAEMLEKYPRDRKVLRKRHEHGVGTALWFALRDRGVRWPQYAGAAETLKRRTWDAIYEALGL